MKNKWEKLFDEFLDFVDFELIKHNSKYNKQTDEYGYWSLIDLQDANIGNIEGDRFESANDIIDRLDIYIEDYIINSLVEMLEEKNIEIDDCCDLAEILQYKNYLPYAKWDFDVLDMICNHSDEINLENCTYKEEE